MFKHLFISASVFQNSSRYASTEITLTDSFKMNSHCQNCIKDPNKIFTSVFTRLWISDHCCNVAKAANYPTDEVNVTIEMVSGATTQVGERMFED